MHCPSCGKPATSEQFCRACGMNLEVVGRLVANHSATPILIQEKTDQKKAEQVMVRNMFTWIIWGMIILGVGVALLLIDKNFAIGRWLHITSSFLLLGGLGVAAGGVLNGIRRGTSISGTEATAPELYSAEQRAFTTNPFPEVPPSVTERTTKILLDQSK